jgi:hypothetical protein
MDVFAFCSFILRGQMSTSIDDRYSVYTKTSFSRIVFIHLNKGDRCDNSNDRHRDRWCACDARWPAVHPPSPVPWSARRDWPYASMRRPERRGVARDERARQGSGAMWCHDSQASGQAWPVMWLMLQVSCDAARSASDGYAASSHDRLKRESREGCYLLPSRAPVMFQDCVHRARPLS